MLPSFRLTELTKTVFGSLAGFCLLPARFLTQFLRDTFLPAKAAVLVRSDRRTATHFRHATAHCPPTLPRLIVYWPSPRTRPLARAHAVASAFLATDRLPIAKPKVSVR